MAEPIGSHRYATPEAAMTAIDADVEMAEERARRSARWAQEMSGLRGEGRAEHGGVRVVVNLDGLVTGLSITDQVAALGGDAVTKALHKALTEAIAQAASKAEALTRATWDDMPSTVAAVSSELDSTLVPPFATDGEDGRDQPPSPTPRGGNW